MNLKTGFYVLLAAFCLTCLFSCSGTADEIEYEISTDAQLISFSLSNDSLSVLATAKFSIDQVNSLIYNRDSLPYLSDTANIASVKIRFTAGSGANPLVRIEHLDGDTAWVANDSIMRFAHQFSLQLYAPNGITKKTYTVRINIHQIDPDSVQYHSINVSDAPTPAVPDWENLTQDCPYEVIAYLGFLRPNEQKELALIVKDEDDLRFALSKDLVEYELGGKIPEGFPTTGYTTFNDQKFANRLTIISRMQSVWTTEDGFYWVNLFGTEDYLPVIEGGSAFFYNNEIWFLNGKTEDGEYNSKVYYSIDGGRVWRVKPKKVHPPANFPLRQNATVIVDAEGKYFYIVGGQNQEGQLDDAWKAALNFRLFER